FALLAISITCMGLFGVAGFTLRQRTREVGIRKVFGATVSQLLFLLSGSFGKWVLVATAVGSPVAWYLLHRWLQNFAYHIELTIWPFLWSALILVLIAGLTISWQTIRAATANPVETLRYE
ncbi:MAG TPA: FtsX-like permease family protein, partial [bacterium]|nr:FtsX-like permease family protein [bacterium]